MLILFFCWFVPFITSLLLARFITYLGKKFNLEQSPVPFPVFVCNLTPLVNIFMSLLLIFLIVMLIFDNTEHIKPPKWYSRFVDEGKLRSAD